MSAQPPDVPIPQGFPVMLDDDELAATAAEIADGMRIAAGGMDSSYIIHYAPLHEVARGELYRRSLVRTERLARRALWVATLSAIVSVTVGGVALAESLTDSTADRVVDVRVELERQRATLEQIRDRLPAR